MQHTSTHSATHTATHTATYTATRCNTCCNTHCNRLEKVRSLERLTLLKDLTGDAKLEDEDFRKSKIHCNTLQHAATHCTMHCNNCDYNMCSFSTSSALLCQNAISHCVAVCCSVLQCVAVCCSVLQCVAVCCSVLQCVAVCFMFD